MHSLATAVLIASVAAAPAFDAQSFKRLGDQLSILGVSIQRDTLGDAVARLGQAEVRHNGGDAAASASAACYAGADGTVLAFISVSEMGDGRRLITAFHLAARKPLVSFAPVTPDVTIPEKAQPTCASLPALSRTTTTAGGLKLGMRSAEVLAVLGRPSEMSASRLRYYAQKDGSSGIRSLDVQLANDLVVGLLAQVDLL